MEKKETKSSSEEEGIELGSDLGFPYWVVARRKHKLDDPFFAAGNIERELLAKQVALDLTEDERSQIHKMEDIEINTVFCPIAGCGARLTCLEEFEEHYHSRHTASCSICSRVYPTSRLLSIHVSEVHDSFFKAKVARGFPMYECLVEGCAMKFKSYCARKQHLIDKHKFPSSFEFFKRAHPSKHQRQKYQQKQAAYKNDQAVGAGMDVDGTTSKQPRQKYKPKSTPSKEETKETQINVEMKMDDLVSAVSKLSTSDISRSL